MVKTAASVWSNCLKFISDNISDQAYKTWFEPIRAIKLDRSILTIQVPSKFFYEWLEEHYLKILKMALQKELGPDAKLVYSIVMEKNLSNKDPYTVKIPSSNREKLKPQELDAPLHLQDNRVKNPFVIPGLQKLKIDSQLNVKFDFNSFIEGDANRLARSAGKAIAVKPGGTAFNPLFIYSGVGLGKTHLAHAIGLEVKDKHPEKTVLYVSMDRFAHQYSEASRSNNRNDFVHFYQMIDVLIIDDVQLLSGKKGTQDVFFHIFNHLHQRGNQLILTSDKPPVDIQDMEQRLISRFKWGLSAEIQPPDYQLRYQILRHILEEDGFELPEDVVDYIAKSVKTNVRELVGAKNTLVAQSLLNRKEVNLELAERVLANHIDHQRKEISIEYIQNVVCDYFKIPLEKVQSKTRKRDIVQARQLAMYFAKKYTNASLASIGSQIGNRDHATVLHACKTVRNLSDTDKVFKGYVDDLKRKIGSDI